MSSSNAVRWNGHPFHVYPEPDPANRTWLDSPGLYIFAGLDPGERWLPLYVGASESLARRLANHDQWTAAQELGATHIHAAVVQKKRERAMLEKALITTYLPPLNALPLPWA